jgi:hypothetical protein
MMQYNMMTHRIRSQQQPSQTATVVLLDNQASRSVFKNRSLLHNVDPVAPFSIGGIDSGSKGLRITEEGDFKDLGRVGCVLTAAAKILSKARLLDDLFKDITYKGIKGATTLVARH